MCRLTSQSLHKDLYLSNLKLALNPEFEDFVEIVDSIGCNLPREDGFNDELSIEPGEAYECLFKLKVGKVKIARSFTEDRLSGRERKSALSQPQDQQNNAF